MKRFLSLFALVLCAMCAFAKAWRPETLPVPKNTNDSTQVSYVSNPDGVLTAAEVASINDIMFRLEKNQGVRGLIIAVKEIDPDDPYEFTIGVGNLHGIGGKSNTGFIIMVASVSRAYEIMPGEGMEKFLTDAECSTIGRNEMVPLLKEGKWGEAVLAGLNKVAAICNGEEELAPDKDDEEGGSNFFLWVGGGFAGLIGLGAYNGRKKRECPKCKKHNCKIKLRHTVLAADEEGAPSEQAIEEAIQSKLFAMKVQKNSQIADKARLLASQLAAAGELPAVAEVEADAAEDVKIDADAAEDVKMDADTEVSSDAEVRVDSLAETSAETEIETETETDANSETETDADNKEVANLTDALMVGDALVTPAVAAAALKIASQKRAFDSETTPLTKEQKSSNKGSRRVRLIDTYECPDCGCLHRKERASTTQLFKLGLFTSGTFGAIASQSSGSRGGSGLSGGVSSGRSSGSYRSSSRSSHSWGSSGGGHFGGGGAGGRF